MSYKKRDKNKSILKKDTLKMSNPQNFDDVVDNIFAQTMASVVEMETYPRSRNADKETDDTQVYYSPRSKKRYEQDPYTVAQHMEDRTVFRH